MIIIGTLLCINMFNYHNYTTQVLHVALPIWLTYMYMYIKNVSVSTNTFVNVYKKRDYSAHHSFDQMLILYTCIWYKNKISKYLGGAIVALPGYQILLASCTKWWNSKYLKIWKYYTMNEHFCSSSH